MSKKMDLVLINQKDPNLRKEKFNQKRNTAEGNCKKSHKWKIMAPSKKMDLMVIIKKMSNLENIQSLIFNHLTILVVIHKLFMMIKQQKSNFNKNRRSKIKKGENSKKSCWSKAISFKIHLKSKS
jgi:hypothetical protein